MDPRNDICELLVSRRARITPERAGLAAYGSPSQQAFQLLASWASTPQDDRADRRHT